VNGLRHENLEQLSFLNDSFDFVISNDVFEHIENPARAMEELGRVLRPGGELIVSTMIYPELFESRKRARLHNGAIEHLHPPVYHSDPLVQDGCLVYTDFGWDIFDFMRNAGFADCALVHYWSYEYGHLGGLQYFIYGQKGGSAVDLKAPKPEGASPFKVLDNVNPLLIFSGASTQAKGSPIAPATEGRQTCDMCNGLYVKANGELPCWCGPGENIILDTIDRQKLMQPSFDLPNHPVIQNIRRAFQIENRLPFPDVCEGCANRRPAAGQSTDLSRTHLEQIHLEASWLCNLDCPLCVKKSERKNLKSPPYHIDLGTWEALFDNLERNGVRHVGCLHIEGRGDPLMHPNLPKVIEIFRSRYPTSYVAITTNGNFRFNQELLEVGLSVLRVSVDGAWPENYAIYRRDGDLNKCLRFMNDAAVARKKLGFNTEIEWKYILFEWNDTDEEMLDAYALARDMEIKLSFCLTPHAGKSRRFDFDSLDQKIAELMPMAINRPSRHVEFQEYWDSKS
jgi:molybdenum cofactor biosynthesis enzyme MoaA